jgi:hypothetical protein
MHPMFPVPLHETPALEAVLCAAVVSREQLHSWPLSSVELLTTRAGPRWIYKAQLAPTVEAEFYRRARTDLLPAARVISENAGYAALLIEFLDLPTVDDLPLDESGLVAHGRGLIDEIGRIGGDPPVYVDLGTTARWQQLVATTLDRWTRLVDDGRFELTTRADVAAVEVWASSAAVTGAIARTSQLVNGDFKGNQVFVTGSGYRIVDWQRPYRAPAEVDLVTLLEARNVDPLTHVEPAVFGIRWFLLLHWAVEGKFVLLPHLKLFDAWTREAVRNIRRAVRAAGSAD